MAEELIRSDPAIMKGKPTVAGTRITVELILDKLAAGETIEQQLQAHPRLTQRPNTGCPGTCQQLWDTRELHLVSLDYGGETREVGAIDINIDQDLVA